MKSRPPILRPLAAALALSLSAPVIAQMEVSGAQATPDIGTPGSTGVAKRDDAGSEGGRAWSIKPRIGLSMTATDNVNVSGNARKENDLITELSPGVHINARTARLRGYLDYSLRGQFYAKSDEQQNQNSLNAFATLEAIDDWFFVDVSGNISQQTISAFGPQSPSDSALNNNSTETSTYRLSPYIRGQMGGLADYVVRYNTSATRADATAASDLDVTQWIAQVRGSTPFQSLKWTIDGNSQTTDYAKGRETDADLVRLLATYLLTPQFSISASTGWESNNYASVDDESQNTHGFGFDWKPTPRTQVSAFKERRFFGDGHRFSFSHRFPTSSIRYTDTRDISVLPNQFSTVGMGTIYDLYFEQFATQIPDPVVRAAFVNALLTLTGIKPNQPVVSGFMSSQASEQRQQQLAFVLLGKRNTLTLQLNRSENSSIATALTSVQDDFSQSSLVQQKGITLTLSHRLSALSTLNATASRQKSSGSNHGTNDLESTTTLYQVSLGTKLGAKTNGSLSVRRSEFDDSTNPYTENALICALTYTY